jgi:hypothetical protein
MLLRSRTCCSGCFWGGVQAGEEEVNGLEGLAAATASGGSLSTIQLVSIQASLTCFGACFARNVQVMSRRWLFS